jgi:hypothetical protein
MKNRIIREVRGSVTVFLACIMLVVVMFEGTIIDSVKIFSGKQVASDANDLALNSVLASYDRDLKKYYGLLAIDSDTSLNNVANRYFRGSINAANTGAVVAGGSTFLKLDGGATSDYVAGSSLANTEAFKTQLMEYEKYFANSTFDDEDELTLNMEIIKPATGLIRAMLEYDKKLYQIQDMLQQAYDYYCSGDGITAENRVNASEKLNTAMNYADELPGLWNSWNTYNSAAGIPDDISSYMASKLQSAQANMITRSRLQNVLNSINAILDDPSTADMTYDELEDRLSGDADFAYVFSLCYSAEAYVDRDLSVVDTRNALLQNANENNLTYNFQYENGSGTYPVLAAENRFYHDLRLNYQDNIQVVDAAIEQLEQINSLFDTDYMQGIIDARDDRFLVMEYAMEMFLSWNYCELNLTGENLYDCSANPNSDREYIICGEATGRDNIAEVHALAMDYAYMWNIIESLCTYTDNDTVSYQNAKKLTVVENLATPLADDVFLIGYALKKTNSDVRLSEDSETPMSMQLYRGNGEYMCMDYADYCRLGIMITMENEGEEVILQRMRNVIEMNMAYLGHTNFSFDNAYTMASVSSNVTVYTSFMRNISFTCTDFGGY